MKPLMDWELLQSEHASLVWQSRLDGKYQLEVHRIDGETHRGTFYIWDHSNKDKQIFTEDVPLMYGAQFGPDVADIQAWMDKGIEVVDNLNGKSPEA